VNRGSILIDATAVPRDRGGVGRYLDGLLGALAALDAPVAVVCKPEDAPRYSELGLAVEVAPSWVRTTPLRLIWEQLALPRRAARGGYAVVHSPHYTFPLLGRFDRVVTIHDLTFFTLPGTHSAGKRLFFRAWLRTLARRSFPVIAVSETTAREFARVLRADPERITVAAHGYDEATFRPPSPESVEGFAQTLDPPVSEWVAFLGTLEPRKNVPALVEAHELLGTDAPALLLAGGAGWDADVVPAVERSQARGHDVRLLGYLPLEQLAPFLGGAEIVAYPSLGEGFGLPVLEAMASGAAVLTSQGLALPEVGGDAVEYAGTSAPEIGEALLRLHRDPARRAELRTRARARAGQFSWRASAQAHLSAYRRTR
jgi:glycosyltransferase involved in cell wall biosynthesis